MSLGTAWFKFFVVMVEGERRMSFCFYFTLDGLLRYKDVPSISTLLENLHSLYQVQISTN
jgi:hypothetical protein